MEGITGGVPPPDDFLAELARWSAADRVSRAAAERSRTRSLHGQSAADATWAGLLVDLAEARAEVTVSIRTGMKVSGRLMATARDFVVLENRSGAPVMLSTDAISCLAPSAGTSTADRPGGGRRPRLELSLAGALDALAGERAPVVVWAGPESVTGSVVACGEDLVTIRAEGATQRRVYLPLGSVMCVELR